MRVAVVPMVVAMRPWRATGKTVLKLAVGTWVDTVELLV